MRSAKDMFLEERESESLEDSVQYQPLKRAIETTPATVKECIPLLNKLDEDIKKLQAERKALFKEMVNIGYVFENPDNLPEGVIEKMVDGKNPYIYAWNTGKRLNVKTTSWYDGEHNCYRNPFFDWGNFYGEILKNKEKKYYEND